MKAHACRWGKDVAPLDRAGGDDNGVGPDQGPLGILGRAAVLAGRAIKFPATTVEPERATRIGVTMNAEAPRSQRVAPNQHNEGRQANAPTLEPALKMPVAMGTALRLGKPFRGRFDGGRKVARLKKALETNRGTPNCMGVEVNAVANPERLQPTIARAYPTRVPTLSMSRPHDQETDAVGQVANHGINQAILISARQ